MLSNLLDGIGQVTLVGKSTTKRVQRVQRMNVKFYPKESLLQAYRQVKPGNLDGDALSTASKKVHCILSLVFTCI